MLVLLLIFMLLMCVSCLQMYSEKFNVYFYEQMFFWNLGGKDYFWEIIANEQYYFHYQTCKFLGGRGFNIFVQKYFTEEWEKIYSSALYFFKILYESIIQSIFFISSFSWFMKLIVIYLESSFHVILYLISILILIYYLLLLNI